MAVVGSSSKNVGHDGIAPLPGKTDVSGFSKFAPSLKESLENIEITLAGGLDDEGRFPVLLVALQVVVHGRDRQRRCADINSLLLEHVLKDIILTPVNTRLKIFPAINWIVRMLPHGVKHFLGAELDQLSDGRADLSRRKH